MSLPATVPHPDAPDRSGVLSTFVGRQAIFDRRTQVSAYELLYRGGDVTEAVVLDGTQATAEVLATSLVDIGLDRLVESKPVFINVGQDFLMGQHLLPVSPHQAVLEILEDVRVDPPLVEVVARLHRGGFVFALDDFLYDEQWLPLLPYVSIVKVDVLGLGLDEVCEQVHRLARFPVKLLAEKVETQDEYDAYVEMGFHYFQGYFLSRPKVITGQRLSTSKRGQTELLAALQDPAVDTQRLVDLIEQDVGLSFRLLRFLNSAALGLQREVNSIERAIVFLGEDGLRRWGTLICLTGGDPHSPELARMSLVRGKMCERLRELSAVGERGAGFTTGLFSALEAFMRAPLAEILSDMPLAADIKDALVGATGPLRASLACTLAYERFDWPAAKLPGVADASIAAAYGEAQRWADELILGLAGDE